MGVEGNGKGCPEGPSLYYDVEAVEAEMQKAQAAEKAQVSASSSHSNTASNFSSAATSSLLSADADRNGLSPLDGPSSFSQAKVEPCRIPRAFAPPARGGK